MYLHTLGPAFAAASSGVPGNDAGIKLIFVWAFGIIGLIVAVKVAYRSQSALPRDTGNTMLNFVGAIVIAALALGVPLLLTASESLRDTVLSGTSGTSTQAPK